MSGESKFFFVVACVFLATAGALAAFGFHGPEEVLAGKRQSWGWAVDMQYYHGAGLIAVGFLTHLFGASWWFRAAGGLMIAGVFVFSFLVYLNVNGVLLALSPMVPTGGSMLMGSWLVLGLGIILTKRKGS